MCIYVDILCQVAESAFSNLLQFKQSQAVLISGESGAGKTEATKVVLHYLTQRSRQLAKSLNLPNPDEGSIIQQRILDANPVLEAFGNAKTVRNNNSSRFGKLFQVQYDRNGNIVGALLTKYLLEKSRVVSQVCHISLTQSGGWIYGGCFTGDPHPMHTPLLGVPVDY
jgi:myosin heavy subunit